MKTSISHNQIHRGDCIKLLAKLEKQSVDLVFADPPFNIGYDYDVYEDSRSEDEYLDWSKRWISVVYDALKPDGAFWLAIGDEYAAELKVLAKQCGFHCRSWVIWYYTFGVNCRKGFSRSHTHLFYFVKDRKNFTFNEKNPAIRIPSARQLVYADARANPAGRLPDNTWILRPQDIPNGFPAGHDTWYFPRVAGTFKEREGFHGCQMPEQLLGRIIRTCSHAGELVVDPFGGSGTTLAVAKKLGRRWMGFELSKDYVKRIKDRLKHVQVGDELNGPEDPLKSAPTTSNGKQRKEVAGKSKTDKAMKFQAEVEKGVTKAFKKVSKGFSVDYLLANPDLNESFTAACKDGEVPGYEVQWFQALLRLRKSKRLPHATKTFRMTTAEMEPFQFASEIAFHQIAVSCGCSLDEVLCNPDLVAEFDRLAEQYAPGYSPLQYRWAAISFRKQAKSNKNAAAKFADYHHCDLPASIPLKNFESVESVTGVYVLMSKSLPIYVGQATDIPSRLGQIADNPAWRELEITSAIVVPVAKFSGGLKSVLATRLDSLLNSQLIRLESIIDAPQESPVSVG